METAKKHEGNIIIACNQATSEGSPLITTANPILKHFNGEECNGIGENSQLLDNNVSGPNPMNTLKNIKMENLNRPVIAQLNINST